MATDDNHLLADITGLPVLDETGAAHEIQTLWRDRRTALVFIRHFG